MLITKLARGIWQRLGSTSSAFLDAVALPVHLVLLSAVGLGTYGLWQWLADMHPPLLLDRLVLVAGSALLLGLAVRLGWAALGPVTVSAMSLVGGLAGPWVAGAHPRTVVGQIARWGIASILVLVVKIVQSGEAQGTQERSDRAAEKIFAMPRIGGYWLYLRPFSTDGRIPVQIPPNPSMMGMHYSGNASYIDLQTVLRDAAPRGGEFVAIGRPGELMSDGSWSLTADPGSLELNAPAAIGAGKATASEAEWRSVVRTTAEGADMILVIPFDYPGTMWEVEMIRERGYLPKTVFIMPETLGYARYETEWEKARTAYARKNLTLPAYEKAGMLFTMSDDGTVTAGYKLRANLGRAFRVRRLLRRLGVRGQGGIRPVSTPDGDRR